MNLKLDMQVKLLWGTRNLKCHDSKILIPYVRKAVMEN